MLGRMEQYFMIALLKKPMTKHDCKITSRDFYTMTSFLSRNDAIVSEETDGRGSKIWQLTGKGQWLALWLNTLDNFDREYFDKYFGGNLNR